MDICDIGFGKYKGIEVKKRYFCDVHRGDVYKSKEEAIKKAKQYYQRNVAFADGTIPFELVFYIHGIGWQIFSSNTVNNYRFVFEKVKEKKV